MQADLCTQLCVIEAKQNVLSTLANLSALGLSSLDVLGLYPSHWETFLKHAIKAPCLLKQP